MLVSGSVRVGKAFIQNMIFSAMQLKVIFVLVSVTSCCRSWVILTGTQDPIKAYLNPEEQRKLKVVAGNDEERQEQLRFDLIYPGTKWCGPGDKASSYDDLGTAVEADMCCREHDHCPDTIKVGATKHNLTNDDFYTKLSCECDTTFHKCLRSAQTKAANSIGRVYFNMLNTQCFREDFPVTGCKKESGFLFSTCEEYSYDYTGSRRYQWFDVPKYP